ncbi:unnamed protein product, partial [marine sediment metagenome]
ILHLIVNGTDEISVSTSAVTLPTNELILTSGDITFTGDLVQKFNAANYLTTTVADSGVVKVTVTGLADSYEVVSTDIILDAGTSVLLEASTATYSFGASTLDMDNKTITDVGNVTTTNAAGPSLAESKPYSFVLASTILITSGLS